MGGRGGSSGGGSIQRATSTLNRGISSTVYSLSRIEGSELQVVTRTDGYRSIASFNLPASATGKGFGQRLLRAALREGPILNRSESDLGNNLTSSALRVRQALIRKGIARVITDEFGIQLLVLT